MSFGTKILVGVFLGIATGLFLGDLAAPLQIAADGFVRLLQMTVLPYAERALARANRLVVRLTPIGLFAIAAHTAGTMDLQQVARLRVFQIAYAAMALLLALWVFPGLVACLTPVPARRVLPRGTS